MRPRANTLGLLLRGNQILLEEVNRRHSQGDGPYYRPLGGTIELGERSSDTLVREFLEEIDAAIMVERYITCIENIFSVDGNIGHEITQIYLVNFRDQELYQKEIFLVSEGDQTTLAKWVSIEEILSGEKPLYPGAIVPLLRDLVSKISS